MTRCGMQAIPAVFLTGITGKRVNQISLPHWGTANGCIAKWQTGPPPMALMLSRGQHLSAAAYLLSCIIFTWIMGWYDRKREYTSHSWHFFLHHEMKALNFIVDTGQQIFWGWKSHNKREKVADKIKGFHEVKQWQVVDIILFVLCYWFLRPCSSWCQNISTSSSCDNGKLETDGKESNEFHHWWYDLSY